MRFTGGNRLGSYEILSALGAGGMGEVYRARDTKLGREVALKLLPDTFVNEPERVARFQREAQLLAALNHPQIGAIYGLEQSEGSQFLVLELVDGETLAQRIARGPVPLVEALGIARQVIAALEAAHDRGIIHRDLKPANIALTAEGQVKVLDFGLAKAMEPESGGELSHSPTLTFQATRAGVILGTAAYMSPEQAKGRVADKRSDVWAFGCVLFEMLTGKKAFEGEDISDTLAAILRGDPDWSALPADVPPWLRTILKRCLAKDRQARIPDLSVVRFLLDDPPSSEASPASAVAVEAAAPPARWARMLPWAAAAAFGVGLAIVLLVWPPWRQPPSPRPLRLSAEIGAGDAALLVETGAAAVVSPDGKTIVFVAQKDPAAPTELYVRPLGQLKAIPLPGTEEATNPFFSPDSEWIGFFARGKLSKVAATGGAAVTLCDAPAGRGGAWSTDGTIVFTPNTQGGIFRVSSAGGMPELLTKLGEGETTNRWPQFLPGGKAVLFTAGSGAGANLVVQPFPTGSPKVVQKGGYYGRYVASGHLVYIQDGTLFAAPFDLGRLEVTGQAFPALEGIATTPGASGAQFTLSENGTLAYVAGQTIGADAPVSWMDHTGKTTPLRAMPVNWANPRFSPDGQRLALDISDGRQVDIWVYEWARDTLARLTFDPADDQKPVWAPDGRRIAFGSKRGDKTTFNLYWERADGAGEAQRLTESKNNQLPASWHPSGKFLAFFELTAANASDLMILPMEGDETSGWKPGKPYVFLSTPAQEVEPRFSPDGKWLAYMSNESGRAEVYVRPFPGPGGKWQISNGGDINIAWSRVRHELFYSSPDLRIMVAPYTTDGDSFKADKPGVWSDGRFVGRPRAPSTDWDLHPDGARIAIAPVAQAQNGAKQDKVVLIFNFFDELRRIAPAKK